MKSKINKSLFLRYYLVFHSKILSVLTLFDFFQNSVLRLISLIFGKIQIVRFITSYQITSFNGTVLTVDRE